MGYIYSKDISIEDFKSFKWHEEFLNHAQLQKYADRCDKVMSLLRALGEEHLPLQGGQPGESMNIIKSLFETSEKYWSERMNEELGVFNETESTVSTGRIELRFQYKGIKGIGELSLHACMSVD